MMPSVRKSCFLIFFSLFIATCFADDLQSENEQQSSPQQYIVNDIIIVGNKYTPTAAILNYIPYRKGEIFNPHKSSTLIRNLYHNLKRFRNIQFLGDLTEGNKLNLYVVVEEKTPLKDVLFKGTKQIAEKEIRKKIDFDVPAIDPEELKVFIEQIKKLYLEKGFEQVAIQTDMHIGEDGKAEVTFSIDEGKKGRIRRIKFEGNTHIKDKELRDVLFTKEEWILSALDKTGTYHPERLEADKHMIEQHYQNAGYMRAKVLDVKMQKDPDSNIMDLLFIVEEGDPYIFGTIDAVGNDIISGDVLRSQIPIASGQQYSRDRISNAMKRLESLWGNLGYIFAHVEPTIDVDEDAKKVNVTFISDIGKQIKLNLITIKGNKKTRDKVIRRRLSLREGAPLTQAQMDISKNNVSNLGYFEQQDGVNWKIRRLDEENADLDLIIKEAKTGHANVQIGFGGTGADMTSPLSGVNFKGNLSDTNLFGTGAAINLEGSWAKEEQTLVFHLAQPWMFDKPITGAMDIYHRRPSYDMLSNVESTIHSKITGGALTAGFITNPRWTMFNNAQVLMSLGIDSINYDKKRGELTEQQKQDRAKLSADDLKCLEVRDQCECKTVATVALRFPVPPEITNLEAREQYARILLKEFKPGEYVWLAANIKQDKRNHPMLPNRGHKWEISTKVGIPSFQGQRSLVKVSNNFFDTDVPPETQKVIASLYAFDNSKIAYGKLFMDYTWYTPIINEYDLIFKLHLFFGLASPIKNNAIPFNELFHIGGDTTVRGFSYGQIGPKFLGDTIGGKKAFFMNTELLFPITQDFSLRGLVFYDGGAGWDNPYACCVNPALISDNNFSYRHAVGFGIRMSRPIPVRVDWGFKLDPRNGENESQVHFGMSYDW